MINDNDDNKYRSFNITRSEWQAILVWRRQHEIEKHGIINEDDKMYLDGAIGGRYIYHFIPTTIGVLGEIECGCCGEHFTFSSLF